MQYLLSCWPRSQKFIIEMQHESDVTSAFFCCSECSIVLMFCCVALSLLVIRCCWQLLGLSNAWSRCVNVGLSSYRVVLVFVCPEDQVILSSGCKVVGLSCWQIVWCWMNNSMKFIWDQTFLSEMLNHASICHFVPLFFCLCIFLFSFWYPVCWLCAHVLLCPPQYEVLFDFMLMLTKPHREKGCLHFTTS